MSWFDRVHERVRRMNPFVVDGAVAVVFAAICVATVYGQDIHDDQGLLRKPFHEPNAVVVLTSLLVCAPIAIRRALPLLALVVSGAAIFVHIFFGHWAEGALPLAVLFLTFTVAAWAPLREAIAGLAFDVVLISVLGLAGSPGLDAVGAFGVMAQFSAGWAIGVALRHRRAATDAKVREAIERAEAERQSAARVLAEERLRIAQELHDVVAHSLSVIAVQAGAGAHVLDERPDQARTALDAISNISRGTLTELRRLLGVLREGDGARSSAPAPCLADLPRLIEDVRAAGVPVELHIEGQDSAHHGGVELSAYRVVQEALTNVIKHAGTPRHVDVTLRYLPGALSVEVTDDGRGLSARPPLARNGEATNGHAAAAEGSGHGLIGMRERVELWGGELKVGPAPGGGYRVLAQLPYGDAE